MDLKKLSCFQLNKRVKNQVDEKKRMLQAISANVSSEGQSLYIAISKTISEVRWNNSEIVVWNQEVSKFSIIKVCIKKITHFI